MKKNIAVFVTDGTEAIEFVAPVDIWRRAGHNVTIISVNNKEKVVLNVGIEVTAQKMLESVDLNDFDAYFIAGGQIIDNFEKPEVQKLAKFIEENAKNKDKLFFAICAAPYLFAKWKLFSKDTKVTNYPSFEKMGGFEENYVGGSVVRSGNIVTGEGPGASLKFAYETLELLSGTQEVRELKAEMQFFE
jgi:4-methyl-5(b-hydroxyethyl)-thiazole monophosphate biosynthesis